MPFKRKLISLVPRQEEITFLEGICARGESISKIARKEQTDRTVVEHCFDSALSGSIVTALRDLGCSGRPTVISGEGKAWVIHLACSKPSDCGYAADRWTIAQLACRIREQTNKKRYPALVRICKSGLHHILAEADILLHKTAYYLEKTDGI
jgi:hypothetical protein